jgi:DNA repair protein RadD
MFKVDHITITRHDKIGAPSMMKVSYFCGFNKFDEYIGIGHDKQFVLRKARMWWAKRSESPLPGDVETAIEVAGNIKHPTHLKVWINKKYPEILAECYDGTAFGTLEQPIAAPFVQSDAPRKSEAYQHIDDDEIPF